MFHTFDALVRRLAPIVSSASVASLHPSGYFMARSGVITLACTGFPHALLRVKSDVERALPTIPPENPGSRWPKVTLGALRSKEPVSLDEVRRVRAIAAWASAALDDASALSVDALELVAFRCRSLEMRVHAARLPLEGAWQEDVDEIPESSARHVRDILRHFDPDRLPDYYPEIAHPGYREAHYRNPYHETTLVYPLPPVIGGLDAFVEAVEAELPGRYAWFSPESRHVTIRALGPWHMGA